MGWCGDTFLSNEELELHTKDHEESRYPCASCDEFFRTTTDLADHVYTEHENNLDMTIPEDVEYGEDDTSNVCPLCEQSFVTYLDLQICYNLAMLCLQRNIQNKCCPLLMVNRSHINHIFF